MVAKINRTMKADPYFSNKIRRDENSNNLRSQKLQLSLQLLQFDRWEPSENFATVVTFTSRWHFGKGRISCCQRGKRIARNREKEAKG